MFGEKQIAYALNVTPVFLYQEAFDPRSIGESQVCRIMDSQAGIRILFPFLFFSDKYPSHQQSLIYIPGEDRKYNGFFTQGS